MAVPSMFPPSIFTLAKVARALALNGPANDELPVKNELPRTVKSSLAVNGP